MTPLRSGTLRAFVALTVAALGLLTIGDRLLAARSSMVQPIDTTNRAEVAASFSRHVEGAAGIAPGWNGSAQGCRAGQTSSDYAAATVETINWFRRMADLPPVSTDTVASNDAQKAALMMHAEGSLSHTPSSSWACFTSAGRRSAGSSNLTLGVAGSAGVVSQIEDAGASNTALGHRRWLLSPELQSVGIGNTTSASVVDVLAGRGDRRGASWVAWPPEGYVPADVVFPRWSFSVNSSAEVDFSHASVSVSENGRAVAVSTLPLVSGYGDDTLGFVPRGVRPGSGSDMRYQVRIDNVLVSGEPTSYSYEVIAFDPTRSAAPVEQSPYRCRGRNATIVGTNGHDTVRGTPGNDVIVTLDGDDVVYGEGGADVICTGDGDDVVDGGSGRDIVLGGRGDDVIQGGTGRDVLLGQSGRDRLIGNQGDDTLTGGPNTDTIVGNGGNDTCLAEGDRTRACEIVR